MNYGKEDQHLSNTSESLEAIVTSEGMMETLASLTHEMMKESFLVTHPEARPKNVATKNCKRLWKV